MKKNIYNAIVIILLGILMVFMFAHKTGPNFEYFKKSTEDFLAMSSPVKPHSFVKIKQRDGMIDRIPDLAQVATITITTDIRWSELFKVIQLKPDDIVLIPPGVKVIYDVAIPRPFYALAIKGTLVFDPSISTQIKVGTIMVYSGGSLNIEPNKNRTAKIIFSGSIDQTYDPSAILLGLVTAGGSVNIVGKPVNPTFKMVNVHSGEKIIKIDQPPNWPVGTKVIFAASGIGGKDPTFWKYYAQNKSDRQNPLDETEGAIILKNTPDGFVIDHPLLYSHNGAVAPLDRSIVLMSQDPGTILHRAHIMFAGNTKVTMANTEIIGLGRTTVDKADDTKMDMDGKVLHLGTNNRGRYALHAHRLSQEFIFEGNVIVGSPRWGIVNHDSFGKIINNVVFNAAGSGIVGEVGTETGEVEGNLVIGAGGGTGESDDDRFGSSKGLDLAHGGFGFWFRGPFLEVKDNVASGYFPQAGFSFFMHPSFAPNKLPSIADMPSDLKGLTAPDIITETPIRKFENNRAEGIFGNAILIFFYSGAKHTVNNFIGYSASQSSSNGILSKFVRQVTMLKSSLNGGGSGEVLVSEPNKGTIILLDSTQSGFK